MDKTCKKILRALIDKGQGTDFVCFYAIPLDFSNSMRIDALSKSLNIRISDLRAAEEYLISTGYLEPVKATGNEPEIVGFRLSHKGLNWHYFQRREIIKYVAEKWPDFIAVIISIISLIVSIAATLS